MFAQDCSGQRKLPAIMQQWDACRRSLLESRHNVKMSMRPCSLARPQALAFTDETGINSHRACPQTWMLDIRRAMADPAVQRSGFLAALGGPVGGLAQDEIFRIESFRLDG